MKKIILGSIICILFNTYLKPLDDIGFDIENKSNISGHILKIKDYPKAFRSIATKKKERVAVMIPVFDRPHYLQKTIQAIEQNLESKNLAFYFFLDGGPQAKQKENADIIKKSSLQNKTLLYRSKNCGLGINLIDARRFLFDWCDYDLVIVLEDDTIVSPYYFSFIQRLYDWSQSNYDNIGIVSGYKHCFLSPEDKKKNLSLVTRSFVAPYGYCMGKKAWDVLKNTLFYYEDNFLKGIPYKQKDVKAIKEWMKKLVDCRDESNFKFQKFFDHDPHERNLFLEKATASQDTITYLGLFLNGYQVISTVVNRAIHIGKFGTNFTATGYSITQAKVKLDIFEEDKYISSFTRKHS